MQSCNPQKNYYNVSLIKTRCRASRRGEVFSPVGVRLPNPYEVEGLEKRKDIILYLKLPAFFTVPTPIGNYNPDWAIVKEDRDAHGEPTGKEKLYLVRETKSTTDSENSGIMKNGR